MEIQCQYLTMTQLNELIKSLQIFEELFNGSLGTWKIDPEDFELKEYAKPIFFVYLWYWICSREDWLRILF